MSFQEKGAAIQAHPNPGVVSFNRHFVRGSIFDKNTLLQRGTGGKKIPPMLVFILSDVWEQLHGQSQLVSK